MELGLTPDTRWQIDGATLIDTVAAAGFTSLGLTSLLVTSDTPAQLARAGLHCHELLGLVVTDTETTLGWATRVAEQAALAGARWVNTTFKVLDADTASLVERCAAMLAEAGAGMAIEFSPLGPVASIQDGLDMAALAGGYGAGVVVDVWNVTYGPTSWEALSRVPVDRIAYVQFNDALERAGELHDEAMNRRIYPGQGVFDLARFVSTVRSTGWDGVVSVQILSAQLRQSPLADFARQAYEASAPYWL
jgi:sugar phosphate isomerase/epimerase